MLQELQQRNDIVVINADEGGTIFHQDVNDNIAGTVKTQHWKML